MNWGAQTTALQALRRAGTRVDALDGRPILRSEFARLNSIIRTWCLARRSIPPSGVPSRIGIADVAATHEAFKLASTIPFPEFADLVDRMDLTELSHLSKRRSAS